MHGFNLVETGEILTDRGEYPATVGPSDKYTYSAKVISFGKPVLFDQNTKLRINFRTGVWKLYKKNNL